MFRVLADAIDDGVNVLLALLLLVVLLSDVADTIAAVVVGHRRSTADTNTNVTAHVRWESCVVLTRA